MLKLVLTTLIWAFSFSLIGAFIAGKVNLYQAILIRLALASLVFLPFFRPSALKGKHYGQLLLIGALQGGFMYIAYFHSFLYLHPAEVALFTIFTPFYISLFDSISRNNFSWRLFTPALCAVIGALIIRWNEISSDYLKGLILLQLANISFASGQLFYRRFAYLSSNRQRHFFIFFIGALIPVLFMTAITDSSMSWNFTTTQWSVLLYLGVIASGIGGLLWNWGACEVSPHVLAVMNNAVIPAAIFVNLIFFAGNIRYDKFFLGTAVILAGLVLAHRLESSKNTN